MLIDDKGRVKKTLNQKTVDKLLSEKPDITLIDGKGNFLLPGLIDAHGHVLDDGEALSTLDLVGSSSAAEAVKRVAVHQLKYPDNEWVIGRGWNQVLWKSNQFPSAEILDNVAPDKPVSLERIDGHALWINSKAMEIAGIDRNTLDPEGGEFIRDSEGNPTGILIDNAIDIVERKIPPMSKSLRLSYIANSLTSLSAEGITSVHDAGIAGLTIDAYRELAETGKLPVRIYGMISVTDPDYQTRLEQGPMPSLYDDMISLRSVKIVIDGALGSRGAALDAPYSDRQDTKGLLLHSKEETDALTIEAMKKGFQVNSHAIGDRGNRLLLDIFAKYPKYNYLRHRIEHAQIIHVEDIPRFKELNVIPSMQPTHAPSDKKMAIDRLGAKRLEGAYAWRKFLNLDVPIASGSDLPIEPSNPFFGLHAAVTRQDRENQPVGGWRPEDKMTRAEALRSFTLDAAYAAHQEKILGSLEPGKWADFILVNKDYFSINEKDIWTIKVLETWLAGNRVYSAE